METERERHRGGHTDRQIDGRERETQTKRDMNIGRNGQRDKEKEHS